MKISEPSQPKYFVKQVMIRRRFHNRNYVPRVTDLKETIKTFIEGLSTGTIEGKLWIVQKGRIREYQPEER